MRYTVVTFILSLASAALMASSAQAVEFMPTCKATVATYDGNLGGYAGADAKCAAEFPGYRFARNDKVVKVAYDTTAISGYGWVGRASLCTDVYNGSCATLPGSCEEWTSTAVIHGAPITGTETTGPYHLSYCNSSHSLWCCNF